MGEIVNPSDSQNDVISTVTHVLDKFEGIVRNEMPNAFITYDQQLSFETALEQYFASSDYSASDPSALPIFAYKSSVLRATELGMAKRSRTKTGVVRTSEGALTYSVVHGEFELPFMYISKSVEYSEKFEVAYNTFDSFNGTREIVVDLGDEIGEFKYFMEFPDELESKEYSKENVYYKAVFGSIKCRGFYFTFKASTSIIKEINARIYASRDLKEKTELIADITVN